MRIISRRLEILCLLLMILCGAATIICSGLAFVLAEHHETSRLITLVAFIAGTCLAGLSLFYWRLVLQKLKQRRSVESMLQLITPLWGAPLDRNWVNDQEMPRSVHHLLQSLDLQRHILEQCLEYAPFGVLSIGSKSNVAYANPLFWRMTGYVEDDFNALTERAFASLFVKAPGQDEDPATLLKQRTGAAQHVFCHVRQKNGSLLPALVTSIPLPGIDPGREEYLLFIEDMSPGHQIKILQQHCASLLESLNQGIVVLDPDYRITFLNEAFLNTFQMFQSFEHPIIGGLIDEVFRETTLEEKPFSRRLVDLCIESGQPQSRSIDYPGRAGEYMHIQITATPIKDASGNTIGYLLLYEDRTAEKELHDTMRRNDQLETVSQMAASIAHEVRNPMTSVQGFLQLMSQEIDPAHAHSMYLHVMEEDLKRINSIITEYLNFSRMGSDSLEDVWIGTLLHNTFMLLQSEANLKGIHITHNLSPDKNPLLIANSGRLKQVLINLSRNAMEAMAEQGGGTLTLGLETSDDHIVLMIKDTGPGIPDVHLRRIFQPFYTTKQTGTGLGLYVCKQIIEEHGGTIRVQTEEGVGTIFSLYLPKNRLFEEE